ncbi:MAG: hypothetical protein WAV27_18790, partial [Xanthobacteraceae bacterium]
MWQNLSWRLIAHADARTDPPVPVPVRAAPSPMARRPIARHRNWQEAAEKAVVMVVVMMVVVVILGKLDGSRLLRARGIIGL